MGAATATVDQTIEGDEFEDDAASEDLTDDVSVAAEVSDQQSTTTVPFEPVSPAPASHEASPSLEEQPAQAVSSPLEHVAAPPRSSQVSPVESVEEPDQRPPEQS
jgi:hypothetical protein